MNTAFSRKWTWGVVYMGWAHVTTFITMMASRSIQRLVNGRLLLKIIRGKGGQVGRCFSEVRRDKGKFLEIRYACLALSSLVLLFPVAEAGR